MCGAMGEHSIYRELAPIYRDVWDWDIVLLHGDVKVVGNSSCHIDGCAWKVSGADCQCGDGPLISSPVVDRHGRRLNGNPYVAGKRCRDGAIYLDACSGSEIPVLSGKIYRLNGPRGYHPNYAPGSIWLVYRDMLSKLLSSIFRN